MGYPRATKEQLADRSRYKFTTEDVDIPELELSVEVKTLSVEERDALPDLVEPVTGPDGQPVVTGDGDIVFKADASIDDLARVWAVMVSDPRLTVEEVKEFVVDLPAPALDRVIVRLGTLMQADKTATVSQNGKPDEEGADTRRDFRQGADRPQAAV